MNIGFLTNLIVLLYHPDGSAVHVLCVNMLQCRWLQDENDLIAFGRCREGICAGMAAYHEGSPQHTWYVFNDIFLLKSPAAHSSIYLPWMFCLAIGIFLPHDARGGHG